MNHNKNKGSPGTLGLIGRCRIHQKRGRCSGSLGSGVFVYMQYGLLHSMIDVKEKERFQNDSARIGGRPLFPLHLFLGLAAVLFVLCPGLLRADSGIRYRVVFQGVDDRELLTILEAVSDTAGLSEKPPLSLGLLKSRAERDIPRIVKALRAMGFYGAHVQPVIDGHAEPVLVTFHIKSGPQYTFSSIDIQVKGEAFHREIEPPGAKALGLNAGDPALSKNILEAEKGLIRWYRARGFPLAKTSTQKVLVRHTEKQVAVNLFIDSGPKAGFGKTEISGLESVDEAFVREKIPWREGQSYDAGLIVKAQKNLTDTGLFSSVQFMEGESLDQQGNLPVSVGLTEQKHRSIRAGLSYKTDEGPGASASWEHRNLFHKGERLSLLGELSSFTRSVAGVFRKPAFLRDDQALNLSLRLADDSPEAYTSRNVKGSAIVERAFTDRLIIGGGLSYKWSEIDQMGEEESYSLLSTPFHLDWNTSNDLLNPTRGGRLFLQAAPYFDLFGSDKGFAKGRLGYRRYLEVLTKPMLVLAGRVGLGHIEGAERDDIPADERFYAGGGGSIRGYAYQSVGPLSSGNPIGGRGLFEVSLEGRLKISERFGLVGFLDGGGAFTDNILDSEQDILWGTGIGFRYFTPIGPLRLDIGFPLDRREGIDDAFQVYVSLGQAF